MKGHAPLLLAFFSLLCLGSALSAGTLVSEPNLRQGRSAGTVQPVRVLTRTVRPWPDPPPEAEPLHELFSPSTTSGSSTAPLVVADPSGIELTATTAATAGPALAAVPSVVASWPGIGPNSGLPPPDPNLAVGPNHVVQVLNDDFAVFDKAGVLLEQVDFNTVFGSSDQFFDPKCTFDGVAQRFLCVVLRKNKTTQRSWWSLLASESADPTGDWIAYHLDATVDGATPNGLWADYPFIGYDQSAIYLTANMATWSSAFQYAKLRILSKAQIYAGLPAGWWDIWNFQTGAVGVGVCSGDGQKDRSLAPAQTVATSAPAEYVLSAKACGADHLSLRRITQPLDWVAGPNMTTEIIPVGAYTTPPVAQLPKVSGQAVSLNIQSNYLTDKTMYRDGLLYAAHTVGHQWEGDSGPRATLKLYALAVTGNVSSVERESLFGKPGFDYYLPSVAPTGSQDMVVAFGRSSDGAGEFPCVRYTVWPAGGALLGSRNVKKGTASYTNKTWGDYFGAQPDPLDPDDVWVIGEYALGSNNWGTWVGEIDVP